ncbi:MULTISPECIES: Rv1733c family protein [unclassified Streptomyces]|uniref:Rv1733c family protein n=1 Tax=unclassified Streptomyces TaxID=2593676 RepID=UPI003D739523
MARTGRGRGTGRRWLWRWRANPLRRLSDRVEAWIILSAWILALAGGVLAGVSAGTGTQHLLDAHRAAVHQVTAVLTADAPKAPPAADDGVGDGLVWAQVRWTDADGATHTGRAKVEPGGETGGKVTAWTDGSGRLVAEPLTASAAELQSAITGTLAALGTATGVLLGSRLARRPLDRRRMRAWETEWAQVGPRWRKKMWG